MSHFYYIFGILFIIYEIIWIIYSKSNIQTFIKVSRWFSQFQKKPIPFEDWPLFIKRYTFYTVIAVIIFMCWVYTGFFSQHKILYFIYIGFQICIFLPISYFLNPKTKFYHFVHIVCALITIFFLTAILYIEYVK